VDQCGADTRNLVGADRRTHPAAADRQATLHLACGNGQDERNDEIRIVITWIQGLSAETDHLIPRCIEL
jgi:hypothetical protein